MVSALAACSGESASYQRVDGAIPVVQEVYLTPRDTANNIDSPALWYPEGAPVRLLVTAKEADAVIAYDAATGREVGRIGSSGNKLGELDRPNGIAVVDDWLFVVERENHRVQVFNLKEQKSVAAFGESVLEWPYGIAVWKRSRIEFEVFVTDNYETSTGEIPADSLLGHRVHRFDLKLADGQLEATHGLAFGATSGPGILHVVESIAIDPENGILLIAEENEMETGLVKYGTTGVFLDHQTDPGLFEYQAEGIALLECEADSGYWIVADQHEVDNRFVVLDRQSLEHVATFMGEVTRNTDGIAVTKISIPNFRNGAFFAVHDDGSVAAFDLRAIAEVVPEFMGCLP
jgi:3-phytase